MGRSLGRFGVHAALETVSRKDGLTFGRVVKPTDVDSMHTLHCSAVQNIDK